MTSRKKFDIMSRAWRQQSKLRRMMAKRSTVNNNKALGRLSVRLDKNIERLCHVMTLQS